MKNKNAIKETNPKTLMTTYEAWLNRRIGNFGSFHTSILEAYRNADNDNRERLEKAFPEWFVEKSEF